MAQAQTEPQTGERNQLKGPTIADRARELHAVVMSGQVFEHWLKGLESNRGSVAAGRVGKVRAGCQRPRIYDLLAGYEFVITGYEVVAALNIIHVCGRVCRFDPIFFCHCQLLEFGSMYYTSFIFLGGGRDCGVTKTQWAAYRTSLQKNIGTVL